MKLFPVAVMLDFLAARGTDEGPVFLDDSFLIHQRFVKLPFRKPVLIRATTVATAFR